MAKRNASGRSGSRTTSSTGGADSRRKPFDRKSNDKPFKRSGKSGTGKPPRKPPEENSFRAGKPARSGGNSYSKFDKKDSGAPFNKEERSPYGKKRNFSSSQRERPYKKFESKNPASKSALDKREEFSRNKKRSFSTDSKSERPRKFIGKGARDAGGERPYKKFDKNPEEKRPFKREGTSFKKPLSPSTGLRRERPYKKSGETSDASEPKNYSHSERKEAPYKKQKPEFKRDSPTSFKGKREDIAAPDQTGKIRLNKYIANSGVCSRREADELIKMGLISVNGKTITELGYKVNPGDEVRHESTVLHAEKPVYILLNKPKGFLTTTSDPQERKTVMHLIGNTIKERVYPVGRLDRNTTGLLLLTNDGALADKLMHPSHNAKKIYKVELDRPLTKGDAQLILEGVKLEEGKAIVDDLAILSEDKRTVGIEIHIGWNRVIRRIFESLNYEVVKLDRSVYAGLDKKNLGRGEWRFLTKEELVRLKHYK